jgi:hypothetical protein
VTRLWIQHTRTHDNINLFLRETSTSNTVIEFEFGSLPYVKYSQRLHTVKEFFL